MRWGNIIGKVCFDGVHLDFAMLSMWDLLLVIEVDNFSV